MIIQFKRNITSLSNVRRTSVPINTCGVHDLIKMEAQFQSFLPSAWTVDMQRVKVDAFMKPEILQTVSKHLAFINY